MAKVPPTNEGSDSVQQVVHVEVYNDAYEQDSIDFRDTAFFTTRARLPIELPAVSTVLERRGGFGRIVKFDDLRLIVKVGANKSEALTMRFLRQKFTREEIPIPEVYGWRVSNRGVLIYMELIEGSPVMTLWPRLLRSEQELIARQIQAVISNLKRLRQRSDNTFIGSVCRGPVQDVYFRKDGPHGPFADVRDFNDCLQFLITPWIPMSEREEDVYGRHYRQFLSDANDIHFGHADLNLSNIMVSDETLVITGVIDWEQSGWYPAYWEYCKLHLGMLYDHDWRASGWIERVTPEFANELIGLCEYWSYRCP